MSERWLSIDRGTKSGRFYLAPFGKYYDRGYTISMPPRRSLPPFPTPEQLGSLALELLPLSGPTRKSIREHERLEEDAESKATLAAKRSEERRGLLTCQLETRDGQKSLTITPYVKTETYRGPYRGIKEGRAPSRVKTSAGAAGLGRALLGVLQLGAPDPKRHRLFGPDPIREHHWFYVRDLAWKGDKATFERVHQTLVHQGIATDKPEIFDVAAGVRRRIKTSLARAEQVPTDLLLEYGPAPGTGLKQVVRGAKSLIRAQVLIGLDYKLCHVYGRFTTGVVCPPRRGSEALDPYPFDRGKRSTGFPTFPNAPTPPQTEVVPLPPTAPTLPASFQGCWRSGVGFVLDPRGRADLAWADGFTNTLEDAFRTELVHVCWRS